MRILAKFKAWLAPTAGGSTAYKLATIICFSLTPMLAPVVAHAAAPAPWQMGLQVPAGSIAEMATNLHDLLLVVITLISLFVLGLLFYAGVKFHASRNPKPSKTTHNTVIEILWTVIPVLIPS